MLSQESVSFFLGTEHVYFSGGDDMLYLEVFASSFNANKVKRFSKQDNI